MEAAEEAEAEAGAMFMSMSIDVRAAGSWPGART